MKTGIERIAEERKSQLLDHGFTPEKDAERYDKELVMAAASYLLYETKDKDHAPFFWPWGYNFWKPGEGIHGRLHSLAKAGALIAAEIDRLQGDGTALPPIT